MKRLISIIGGNTIPQRIKYLRKCLGLNQDDFGKKIGVSGKSVISRYENGSNIPSVEHLSEISKVYFVSLDWLISGHFYPELGKILSAIVSKVKDNGMKPSEISQIVDLPVDLLRKFSNGIVGPSTLLIDKLCKTFNFRRSEFTSINMDYLFRNRISAVYDINLLSKVKYELILSQFETDTEGYDLCLNLMKARQNNIKIEAKKDKKG